MYYAHKSAIYNLMTTKRIARSGTMMIRIVYRGDWFDLPFDTVEETDHAWETIKERMSHFNAEVRGV